MLITEFFKNQDVFITGGSGFIGKALIEKILRSCPEVGNIFLLIRKKKNKVSQDRLNEFLGTSFYDRLRRERPSALSKVYAIEGDCSELGLGIKPDDLKKLQRVSIIYHSAATVRFNSDLRDAIILNTRGTYELIKLSETLKQLKVFVHVSTGYCNPGASIIQERIYPANADWRKTIKMAETLDSDTLNILTRKYSDYQENTYTFSKYLSEQVVNEYRNKLPIIIIRPSIVISSLQEPISGWIDNYNGPIGLLVTAGLGVSHSVHADPKAIPDYVPIDILIRCMIILAYKKGMATLQNSSEKQSEVEVYNCGLSSLFALTFPTLLQYGKESVTENPFEKPFWKADGDVTSSRPWNFIKVMTLQIPPAYFFDGVLRLIKRKPVLMKLQRRIYNTNFAVQKFLNNTFTFENDKMKQLDEIVPAPELDEFAFLKLLKNSDRRKMVFDLISGAKEFLLREPRYCTNMAAKRYKIIEKLDLLMKLVTTLLMIYLLFNYINKF